MATSKSNYEQVIHPPILEDNRAKIDFLKRSSEQRRTNY